MKIVAADVFVTCPGRNFVTLKITTDDGIVGLGDATLNGRELSVASYLKDHLCPQLIGRDAHRIEDIWQFFYKGAYWRRGYGHHVGHLSRGYGAVGHQSQSGQYAALPAAGRRLP